MKFKNWLEEWLEYYVKPTVKVRTYERYKGLVVHINKGIGDIEINDISPLVLQRFVSLLLNNGNEITKKGLSPSSVNSVITVIQNSLKVAESIGVVSNNPGSKIRRPQIKEKPIDCFTLEEQKKIEKDILEGKKTKLYGVVICLYTGIRLGELLALEWDDVDLKKGTISVTKTCYYVRDEKGQYVRIIDSPKTSTSVREIPIPRQLIWVIKELKKSNKSSFLITNNGKPITTRSYQRSFEMLQKKVGISRRSFHTLRHTFATRALECGMDVRSLAEIMGHKNPMITLNRYAHSLMEHKKEMMNKVGKLL